MSNDFNCEQLEPLISAYHDGELNEAERSAAERHLNGCAVCQNRLLAIGAVASSLNSLPRLNPKVDVAANIEQLIANQPKGISQFKRPIAWSAAGIAAAVAVLAVSSNFNNTLSPSNSVLTANSKVNQSSQSKQNQSNSKAGAGIADSVNPEIASASQPDEPAAQLNALPQLAPDHIASNRNHSGNNAEVHGGAKKDASITEPQVKPSADHNAKNSPKVNPPVQVASIGNAAASGGTTSGARLDGSDTRLIANRSNSAGIRAATIGTDGNLVAVYDTEQRGVTEELGITTDEDGLYAIKL
jgi:hypothetical protein